MMTLFIGFLSLSYAAETNGNPALNRLGIDASQGDGGQGSSVRGRPILPVYDGDNRGHDRVGQQHA